MKSSEGLVLDSGVLKVLKVSNERGEYLRLIKPLDFFSFGSSDAEDGGYLPFLNLGDAGLRLFYFRRNLRGFETPRA